MYRVVCTKLFFYDGYEADDSWKQHRKINYSLCDRIAIAIQSVLMKIMYFMYNISGTRVRTLVGQDDVVVAIYRQQVFYDEVAFLFHFWV